jgi:hypothetical protein
VFLTGTGVPTGRLLGTPVRPGCPEQARGIIRAMGPRNALGTLDGAAGAGVRRDR